MWARDCLEFQLIILHAELTLYERLVEISMRIFTRETDTRSAGTNQLKYGVNYTIPTKSTRYGI